jgi:hypothetical protein
MKKLARLAGHFFVWYLPVVKACEIFCGEFVIGSTRQFSLCECLTGM